MHGLMMDMPLLISSLIRHADQEHGAAEIVSRTVEGPIHRYTYRDAHRRARQLANALTGLGVAAFPRRNLFVLASLLSAFGAFIEFVQGLSIVHRDRDFWDWVADTVAIAMALAPMILVWWRRVVRSGQKNIDI